ncbi:putative ARM repeat superfamily protein [Quillaja saponaria]|uniref:ARM repeat superfamily protein n=1 Tax=Quillaja saponaria TaxID=32244 RepID=A0AAD7VE61_QUISA|nr:putative ARM repeat superfamily protein [Quillaja saponaria]
MIENSLRCKQLKHGGQAMVLINWLFQDELLFEAMAKYLADVIMRKDDRYLSLGWCILVRRLVEYESYTDQFTFDGLKDRYEDLLRILCACFPHLASIVCKGSTLQDGFEFPSRLSVSAADCFLALTEALSKKAKVQGNRSKSNLKTPNQSITLAPGAIVDKKVTPVSNSSEISHFERDYYLWQHLEELICLAEKLLAWSRKSRFLHAKGLEQVFKWLQEIKEHYGHAQQTQRSSRLGCCCFLLAGSIIALYCTWKIRNFLSVTKNCWTTTYLAFSILQTTRLVGILTTRMVE